MKDYGGVDGFAIEFVAGAELELGQAIEHVELGDAQTGQAVDLGRAFEQRRIEPATTAAAPGGHAFFRTDGGHVPARCALLLPFQLGRERAATDTGAIGLGDAQHVMQEARAHASARSGVARHTVAGGHKRIGAVIDVEQRALRALEQQVHPLLMGFVQLARNVGNHGLELFGLDHGLVVHRVELDVRRFVDPWTVGGEGRGAVDPYLGAEVDSG